ncbi:MAG TPA: helix-turn-helix domain-containing protein [Solirubrobacterales bacterium]|jgi:excisionase family DNA binding protein|nr:helix-turn-helix domain-containing protein [Solirubrobacterales bacterium]
MTPQTDTAAGVLLDALVESVAERVIAAVGSSAAPALSTEPSKLAVSIAEAAEMLGVSADHFRRHVLPDLRIVRSGRLRLVPIAELRDWLDRSAARALDGAPLAHVPANPHGDRASAGVQGDAPRLATADRSGAVL